MTHVFSDRVAVARDYPVLLHYHRKNQKAVSPASHPLHSISDRKR